MKGWIKLHRSIMGSSTFRRLNATQQLITIYIILNANHEDGVWYDKYKDIEVPVKRGQLITSRNKIANEWFSGEKDITERKVRTTLDRLEKHGFLTKQTTNGYTLLTICNYGLYQAKENENDQPNDQALTRHRPSNDQAMTTNKNDKNVKNDNKEAAEGNPFKIYEENFGILKPILRERFIDWLDDLGDEVAIAGMKLAAQKGGRTFGYIEEIWKEWFDLGLKDIDQVRAHEKGKANRKNQVTPIKRGTQQSDDDHRDYGF